MTDNNSQIWAKDNGVSLKQHTEDIFKAFTKVKDNIKNNDDTKTCIEWAIKLHDLGKVLPYFQIVTLGNTKYEPWDINKDLNIYHSLASVLFINQEKLKEKLLNNYKNNDKNLKYVLSAIAYHHWKNSLEMDLRYGSEKFEKLLNLSSDLLITNLQNELKELINDENDIIQLNKDILQGLANGLSFSDYIIPPYQLYWLPKRIELDEKGKKKWVLISGFLQRCDHYASFCEEEENWSQEQKDKKNEILNKIEIENIKIDQIKKRIKEEVKIKLNDSQNTKESQDISLWQESKLKENENGNFKYQDNLILIAPTGSGKTEFAFLWSGGEKFFYTLPLRAAVEQIYDRAIKIFGEDKVGLLHSDADVYLLSDDYNYERLKVYDVAKQLSYPLIVSTGDQFFPYGLRPPGYERIYATFSYSRLVIDEIQAYDPRASAIIVKFIEDIYRLGGKFLLMTATLPEYVKKEIEERIKNDGQNNFNELNLYDKEKQKYENLKKHKLSFININNKINDEKIDFSIPTDIIKDIISKAKEKRVLVILNTVKQAKDVYDKIKLYIETENKKKNTAQVNIKYDNIILFHSQFTLNEKQKIKDEIEIKFKNPKDTNDTEGKILVATQVVEAAIDIDADILYTEICPMDALVQRMGRVLRRYKENFSLNDDEEPNVNILIFKEGYESGNGKVYDMELIEKTLIYLNNPESDIRNISLENQIDRTADDNLNDDINSENKKKVKKGDKSFKLESLSNIVNNKSYTLLLSEYKKFELVTKLYASLEPNGNYLSKFYETLSLLDAGFMSDRREEAQKMFREIMNASVVDESKEDDFKKKIEKLAGGDNFNYTVFKKGIIAEFVISIPFYNLNKIKKGKVKDWISNISSNDENKIKKIMEWCEDIFIVDLQAKKINKMKE